jgi:hydroxymethylglutaryl-CoA synthase
MRDWCAGSLDVYALLRCRAQLYNDFLASPSNPAFSSVDQSLTSVPRAKTMTDKDVEKTFIGLSKAHYQARVWPTTQCMRRLGNAYTASVWAALASLVDSVAPEELLGKRVALFSYGSGLAASFFTIRVRESTAAIRSTLDLNARLAAMVVRPCEEYVKALEVRLRCGSSPGNTF